MTSPTYSELVAQVAELIAARAKPLTIDDLPLGDLRKTLIDNGAPLDLSVLAMPGQIPNYRSGVGTLTWPGGVTPSNILQVKHGLTQPINVLVTASTPAGLTAIPSIKADNFTPTTFDVRAETVDGQLPLNTATLVFSWRAEA